MTEHDNHTDRDRQDGVFMSLLVPNQRGIWAFILCLVPNKADAEDILQETLLELWRKFDTFEIGTDFVAWGVTIAKYKVYEYRRKSKGSKLQFRDELVQLLETESEQHRKNISLYTDVLRRCTQKLTSKEQELLQLKHGQDLTLEKIAKRTGISFQAVHKAISRIYAKLVWCIRLTLREEQAI